MFTLRKLFEPRKPSRRSSRKSPARTRLAFESLEGREMLSATIASSLPQSGILDAAKVDKSASSKALSTTTKGTGFDYYRYGGQTNVVTTPSPGLALEGGGIDVDQVYQWMGAKANGGDFLVLGTSGKDAYDPYIYNLPGQTLNSVSTLVMTKSAASSNQFVIDTIKNAEAIFIEGGDQSTYLNQWKGTPVQDAIQVAVNRGVPIGGTSAGNAVLGQFIFSAQNGTADSSTVLANPYDKTVTLDTGFLNLPFMQNTITDDHFYQRDRMGRLDVFMARLVQDYGTPATATKGIGLDEQTALLVNTSTGVATVVGNTPTDPNAGHVYFMETTGITHISPNTPLTDTNGISVQRASIGDTFDLGQWKAGNQKDWDFYTLLAMKGVLSSTQPGNSIY
jgi:cyanophycinase